MTDKTTQDVRFWLTREGRRLLEATNNEQDSQPGDRPVVHIRACDQSNRPARHVVWCATGSCQFVYVTLNATYAQHRALVHRAKHDLEDR